MKRYRHDGELDLGDWFCGAGGSTQGAAAVPGIRPVHAANHDPVAIESHSANFPDVDHYRGDIREIDVSKLPWFPLFWASPECTNWTKAKGKKQTFTKSDVALPGMEADGPTVEEERSRALMEEVPQYLRAMALRGRPVLAGVVENVIDIREWTDWARWRAEIEAVGYRTRLIALNSMHAHSRVAPWAPQSRDRLYLAYWHVSLGRDPDWDKWLRPKAWCPTCEEWVHAVQVFKDPSRDMGRYRAQYLYHCPRRHRRAGSQVVEPLFLPAYTAIDWSIRGERIGDKPLKEFFADKARTRSLGFHPLAPKTLARIEAGIRRFARPVHVEAAGNTFDATSPRHPGHGNPNGYVRTWPVEEPLRTLHTTESKAVAVPSMLVPVEGREGKVPGTVHTPLRTQSTRNETALVVPPMLVPAGGTWNDQTASLQHPMRTRTVSESEALLVPPMLMRNNTTRGDEGYLSTALTDAMRTLTTAGHQSMVVPPFITELRGGGSVARPLAEALATVTAGGGHHGLTVASSTWEAWAAVYQYDTGGLRSLLGSLPTQTTVPGDGLLEWTLPEVEDCLFRMLEPEEIGRGMAFRPDYVVLGNKRQRVAQFGNAVTPPAAEILVSALVECITGEGLERAA